MNKIWFAFVAFALFTSSNASAALVYTFSFSPNAVSVSPGTQTVDIFLNETASGMNTPLFSNSSFGLGTSNFIATLSGPTTFASATAGMNNGDGFSSINVDTSIAGEVNFAQARLSLGTIATNSLVDSSVAPNTSTFNTIRIGTVSFVLGAGESTTLSILTPTLGDFTYSDGSVTGFSVPAGLALTITAVPEPTSMALVGVVGVAGLVARYRRRGVASPTV